MVSITPLQTATAVERVKLRPHIQILNASICTRGGKVVVSRSFREISRSRIEALLASVRPAPGSDDCVFRRLTRSQRSSPSLLRPAPNIQSSNPTRSDMSGNRSTSCISFSSRTLVPTFYKTSTLSTSMLKLSPASAKLSMRGKSSSMPSIFSVHLTNW